jgi:hypothetical protein
MADMLSDIYSIVAMLQRGHAMAAYGMVGLIGASLAVQLLLGVIQTKHRGRRAVAWEIFLVMSLVKPGADALRVASGAEHVAGAPIDPFIEMMLGKALEIAFEAGPGAALQAAIVLSGGWSASVVLSVGISCLTMGFSTSLMAFEMDTSPANRRSVCEFYGYIDGGASKRLLIFVELFALHTAHSMLKTVTVACLARTNGRWLVAYMTVDLGVFICYKIARGDLAYWVPGDPKIRSPARTERRLMPFSFFFPCPYQTHGFAQAWAFRYRCWLDVSKKSSWTQLVSCICATQ